MKYSTHNQGSQDIFPVSTDFYPAEFELEEWQTGVHDVDSLKNYAKDFGVTPSRSNIGRVRRGFDLYENGAVQKIGHFGDERIYLVASQNLEGKAYTVRSNGHVECTCPDEGRSEACKHGVSVLVKEMHDRYDEMAAEQDETEANRFS